MLIRPFHIRLFLLSCISVTFLSYSFTLNFSLSSLGYRFAVIELNAKGNNTHMTDIIVHKAEFVRVYTEVCLFVCLLFIIALLLFLFYSLILFLFHFLFNFILFLFVLCLINIFRFYFIL